MISLTVRRISLVIAIGFCVIPPIDAFAVPQYPELVAESGRAVVSQSKPAAQYLITLSEYRLKGVDVSEMTADNIAAEMMSKKVAPVNTIMLSAVAGAESRVSFGRQVTVTTGRQTNRGTTSRNTEHRDLGTVLSATPTTAGQQVSLALSFSSSQHPGEGTDDSPPDITATSINLTQVFDLGKPTLIGATTAHETSFVFLTVSRQ